MAIEISNNGITASLLCKYCNSDNIETQNWEHTEFVCRNCGMDFEITEYEKEELLELEQERIEESESDELKPIFRKIEE